MEVAPSMLLHRSRRPLRRALIAVGLIAAMAFGAAAFLQASHRLVQWHDDPAVAAAWIVGVTHGPDLTLSRGGFPLSLLNAHGIKALGTTERVSSRFSGDPNGLEIWFAYRSHLRNCKLLECHRVGHTAFADDLGQAYHGFLDFEGDYVGVYLPAYDHAAHRLTCTLHWMPRLPTAPMMVSRPMRFEIELTPPARLLLPAARLASGPVTQTRHGIRVSLNSVHLSSPTFGSYEMRQRDLTFHLDIQGGTLAATNIAPYKLHLASGTAESSMIQASRRSPVSKPQSPLVITDPYGCSLVPQRAEISPMMSIDLLHCTRADDGIVWIAPVNGAGEGTDVVRVRFDVLPPAGAPPVPFDLTARVSSDTEL